MERERPEREEGGEKGSDPEQIIIIYISLFVPPLSPPSRVSSPYLVLPLSPSSSHLLVTHYSFSSSVPSSSSSSISFPPPRSTDRRDRFTLASPCQSHADRLRQMEGVMKKLALWHTRTFRPMMTHDDLEPLMISLGFVPVPLPTPPSTTTTTTAPPPLPPPPPSSSSTPTPSPWREYAFSAAARRQAAATTHEDPGALFAPSSSASTATAAAASSSSSSSSSCLLYLPRPRLPCPRIDGLHILVYRAFIDAVAFYIGAHRVADHFHVRGMPLHRVLDRPYDKVFRMMSDDRRQPAAATTEDEGIFVFREGTLDQATLALCTANNNSTSSSTTTTAAATAGLNNPFTTGASATTPSAGPILMVPLKDINVVIAV